jgi:hypothetical protein
MVCQFLKALFPLPTLSRAFAPESVLYMRSSYILLPKRTKEAY